MKNLLFVFLVAFLVYPGHVFTDGLREAEWDAIEKGDYDPDTLEVSGKGEFYFRVEYRDDVHSASYMYGEVKVSPTEGESEWPGVGVDYKEGYTDEVNAQINFQIRDISVPEVSASRSRAHVQVERERKRGDAANSYLWSLISQSETLIISEPVAVGYNIVEGDLYAVIGGQRLNIAEMLDHDGHGRLGDVDWDWGSRVPMPR